MPRPARAPSTRGNEALPEFGVHMAGGVDAEAVDAEPVDPATIDVDHAGGTRGFRSSGRRAR